MKLQKPSFLGGCSGRERARKGTSKPAPLPMKIGVNSRVCYQPLTGDRAIVRSEVGSGKETRSGRSRVEAGETRRARNDLVRIRGYAQGAYWVRLVGRRAPKVCVSCRAVAVDLERMLLCCNGIFRYTHLRKTNVDAKTELE